MCADPGTPGLVRRLPRFPKTLLLEDYTPAELGRRASHRVSDCEQHVRVGVQGSGFIWLVV